MLNPVSPWGPGSQVRLAATHVLGAAWAGSVTFSSNTGQPLWPPPTRHLPVPGTDRVTISVGRGRTGFLFSSDWAFLFICQFRLTWPGMLVGDRVGSAIRVLKPEVLWGDLGNRRCGGFSESLQSLVLAA